MFIGSRSGKFVFMSDLSLQELSAETYTVFLDFPHEDTSNIILFNSVEVAQEVAYSLRGEWDGCNGVEIPDFDPAALKTAASLAEGQWCEVGDSEFIENRRSSDRQVHSDFLTMLSLRGISSIDVRTETYNLLAPPDFRGLTFLISRAEVYWCIADWNGSHCADDIARVTGFRKSTVQGHLSALEKAGAIRSEGRPKQYAVAEACSQPYLDRLQSFASLARSMRGSRSLG
jgi:DNA-binding transcriptional ArsR family regulator